MRLNNLARQACAILFLGLAMAQQNGMNVILNTKYEDTGFSSEIAEFVAKHVGNVEFWKFIEQLDGKLSHDETQKQQYDLMMTTASEVSSFDKATAQILEFTLATRSLAAKVVSTSQIGENIKQLANFPDNCKNADMFLQYSDSDADCISFENSNLDTIFEKENVGVTETIPGEHIYGDSGPLIMLYGLLENQHFYKINGMMKKIADSGLARYGLRFYNKNTGADSTKISLTGFGVEMAIKSTEYKAVDDSKIEDSNADTGEGPALDPNEEMDGLNFFKLAENFPEDAEKLRLFRQHIVDSSNELTPLKVWQLQDLSYQTVATAMNTEDPLEALQDYSQNFPSRVKKIVKTKASDKFKKAIAKNIKTLQENGVDSGETKLFLNGKAVDLDPDCAHVVEQQLHRDAKVINKLSQIEGLSQDQIKDLSRFSVAKTDGDSEYVLDVRHPDVIWLNDIKKDSRYKNWPSNWQQMLRPTFPGQVHKIRDNFAHLTVFVDPASKESVPFINLIETYWFNDVPARIGVVFVDKSEGSKMLRTAFDNISTKEKGLKWLSTIHRKSDGDMSIDYIRTKCSKKFGDRWAGLMEAASEPSTFFEESGLKKMPTVLVNGEEIDDQVLSNVEVYLERGTYQHIATAIQGAQRGIYYSEVSQGDNYLDYTMNKPNVVPRLNQVILKGPYNYPQDVPTDLSPGQSNSKIVFLVKYSDVEFKAVVEEYTAVRTEDNLLDNIHVEFSKSDQAGNFINCNGREYGPLATVSKHDIDLIIKHVSSQTPELENLSTLDVFRVCQTLFASTQDETKSSEEKRLDSSYLKNFDLEHGKTGLMYGSEKAVHEVILILNPTSEDAQIALPVVRALKQVFSVGDKESETLRINVIFNPQKCSEMPIKNYYRYILKAKPEFDDIGSVKGSVMSVFEDMPGSLLLTMNLKLPEAWMVETKIAAYDLDNIKFDNVEGKSKRIFVEYELEYVLIEGNCYDVEGHPGKGVQLELGDQYDTLVMANLGYFQLKADPGVWKLSLREGPSKQIYHIHKYDGSTGIQSSEHVQNYEFVNVVLDSWHGMTLNLKLDRNPGQENADVLDETMADLNTEKSKKLANAAKSGDSKSGGIWNSMKNAVGLGAEDANAEINAVEGLNMAPNMQVTDDETDVINIFSLASGHLYERFMRMMMVSVRRHSTAKLRFWALSNCASPQFKASVPAMEKEYDIEIRFVQDGLLKIYRNDNAYNCILSFEQWSLTIGRESFEGPFL